MSTAHAGLTALCQAHEDFDGDVERAGSSTSIV